MSEPPEKEDIYKDLKNGINLVLEEEKKKKDDKKNDEKHE